eukprot:CAMPEP_0114630446 /NCGR_PEP_ID=MMETSP0168-20121206/13889_1 /TAXON_ID=95228 ORGANISM="Vannella sp., Strain DIVA3 517/6/12" /NCGR_SAMPLE_ID=MMETSP0168 /ASSEMBLY_ACC=CAM_ASM_000044 /LENGTH=42 /DNA_ID= /DNA_START= /DNA_END= /DNA_ORIENTATION=
MEPMTTMISTAPAVTQAEVGKADFFAWSSFLRLVIAAFTFAA